MKAINVRYLLNLDACPPVARFENLWLMIITIVNFPKSSSRNTLANVTSSVMVS